MGDRDTDDFFREVYNSEIEHRHKLDSADSLLVAVLLALSGAGIYYLKVLPSCGCGIAGYLFLLCGFMFLMAFGFATGFVIASFWPRYKAYIASPNEWGAFVDGLRDYYAHYHAEEEAERRSADDLARSLRKKYIEAGTRNRNLNLKKMAYQTWAKYCITTAVVLMLLNAIPTYFIQCNKTETQKTEVIAFPDVQKIEIVSPKSTVNAMSGQSQPTQPPQRTPPPQPAPQKPEPPQNVLIKDGHTKAQQTNK